MIERDVLARRLGVDGAKVLVLGLAVTGRACARVLAAAGASVLASDASPDVPADAAAKLDEEGVDVEIGSHVRALGSLSDVDLVVPSPGIPPSSDVLGEAIERGVRVAAELDLAQRLTDAKVVGVTGTNGKTTVCRLGERIARRAGFDAYACGNTEVPFIEAVAVHPHADLFVVECSSFRLYFAESFHPSVSVITNLMPDHLDWHRSMDDYRAAKARIAVRQTAGDLFLYPAGQPELATLAPDPGPLRVPFSYEPMRGGHGGWIEADEIVVSLPGAAMRAAGVGALARRGRQFAEDAAAAAAALAFCGADAAAVELALQSFAPDPHRVELVGKRGGVTFYDDSIATNPHAALTGLLAFDSVVLIAGGRKKVPDLSPLASGASRVRAVVAMGEAAGDVEQAFAGTGVPVERAASMSDAVRRAIDRASPGDVVLLAPACASLDAYPNYAERGRDFAEVCRLLGVTM